jgi:hypothetical protein
MVLYMILYVISICFYDGILLQVRMDDPLQPEDQKISGIEEDDLWVTVED